MKIELDISELPEHPSIGALANALCELSEALSDTLEGQTYAGANALMGELWKVYDKENARRWRAEGPRKQE